MEGTALTRFLVVDEVTMDKERVVTLNFKVVGPDFPFNLLDPLYRCPGAIFAPQQSPTRTSAAVRQSGSPSCTTGGVSVRGRTQNGWLTPSGNLVRAKYRVYAKSIAYLPRLGKPVRWSKSQC